MLPITLSLPSGSSDSPTPSAPEGRVFVQPQHNVCRQILSRDLLFVSNIFSKIWFTAHSEYDILKVLHD